MAMIAMAGIVFQAQAQGHCKEPCVTSDLDAKLNRTSTSCTRLNQAALMTDLYPEKS